MSRGYGKYRRGSGSHASFNFDNLFKENTNRPSAARSAATVGKWGITSFTSIRTINGLSRQEPEKETNDSAPKPKKFFKSRDSNSTETESHTISHTPYQHSFDNNVSKKAKLNDESPATTKTTRNSRRHFTSRSCSTASTSTSNSSTSKPAVVLNSGSSTSNSSYSSVNSDKRTDNNNKPPIVLRICHGKSQLVNDSDESESTPTPASTPSTSQATSPRLLPENCRITRSARRSMQQDPNSSSPATADTPTEFSMFTSPKQHQDSDLSPQYIPAEKYELERRAMYDNLLNPKTTTTTTTTMNISPPPNDECHLPSGYEEAALADNVNVTSTEEPETNSNAAAPPTNHESEHCSESDENSSSDGRFHPPILQTPDYSELLPTQCPSVSDSSLGPTVDDDAAAAAATKEAEPPVKLVISKKKGSIFKSRTSVDDGSNKRRALYKHKWCDDKEAALQLQQQKSRTQSMVIDDEHQQEASSTFSYNDYNFSDEPLMRVVQRGGAEATVPSHDNDHQVTSVKCSSTDKGYYTVVRNVKKAHQMQEIGEFQEFNDDVEYILDALQDNNPISTRCLSAISLATKCMAPAFRMHVRAHGTVAKFFKALHDATKDQSLGLCTATVMFVLSQDRLNMDLDRDCLELMLNLLESDVSYQQALDVCGLSFAQLEKNKQKVRELCAEIQSQGHAMHLNLDNITVGQLAMETLLSLTCKRAGEWFKEELRELGGLEHIMNTICECCRQVSDYVVAWTDSLLDKLKKIDRCLRVLENVTHNNEQNQTYLLKYNNGAILDTLLSLYKLCDGEMPLYPVVDIADKDSTGTIIREALLVTLKVLINLTHHFNKQSMGSSLIGSKPAIIETSLHLLLQVPHYIPEQKKFELGVLVLMLLINLIQDNERNKKLLIEAKAPPKLESIYSRDESAVEALIAQFYNWEGCAKIAENRTNAILDGEEKDETRSSVQNNEEFIEETVAKLLQKAGTHMEYTFLASYIVMVIGFLIMESVEYQNNVRQFLKGHNFNDMVEILKKFFNFMSLTSSTEASSVCAMKAIEKVVKYLEECDKSCESSSQKSYSNERVDLRHSSTY